MSGEEDLPDGPVDVPAPPPGGAANSASGRLIHMLRELLHAVSQLRLYAKNSPQAQRATMSAYQVMESFLEEAGALSLSCTDRGLLVNGERPESGSEAIGHLEDQTLKLLDESQIRSLSVQKGLTIDELGTFLHALTHKFWDLSEGKEINARLRAEQVLRVSVDEVVYVAVGEKDLLIEDAADKLPAADARVNNLFQDLDALLATAGGGLNAGARLAVMKKLLDHDPELLRRAREQNLPGTETPGDAAQGRVYLKHARQAVGEVVRLLSGANPETTASLRRIGGTLVEAFRGNPQLAGMMRAFLAEEAADLIPTWMRQAREESAAQSRSTARVTELISMSEEKRVEALAAEGGALAEELDQLGRQDLTETLLSDALACLGYPAGEVRVGACAAIRAMLPAYYRACRPEVHDRLERALQSALEGESAPEAYAEMSTLAAEVAARCVKSGVLEKATDLTEQLRRHYRVKEPGFQQRSTLAFAGLEALASGGAFKLLLASMFEGNASAAAIVGATDVAGTKVLLREIVNEEDLQHRIKLAGIVAGSGRTAGALFMDAVHGSTSIEEALRLVEVLPDAVAEGSAEIGLADMLHHSLKEVRCRAARTLGGRGGKHSGEILVKALREELDPTVRVAVVEAIGNRRHQPAVDMLCTMAASGSEADGVRAAACLALGRIGEPRATRLLTKLVSRGIRGWSRVLQRISPQVRAAAARAMGHFVDNERVRQELEHACSDANPAVRAAASEALHAPLVGAFGALAREVQVVSEIDEVRREDQQLCGSLAQIPLDQVCQLMGSSKKTGLMMLNFDGPSGRIYFEEGMVTAADFGGHSGQKAFNAFCRRKTGYFLFRPNEKPDKKRMNVPVTTLLMEAFRVTDEGAGGEPNSG